MSYLNNQQKLNDIIFANRNREYGAYVIRSSYGNTIFKSLAFMLTGVVAMVSLAYFLSHRNNNDPEQNSLVVVHDSIYVVTVNTPEEEDLAKGAEKNDPPPAAAENTDPVASKSVVVIDAAIETTVAATTETPVETNTTTSIGNGTTSITGPSVTTGVGGGGTDTSAVVDLYKVDSPPIYEGGPAALRQFVSEHLKYPHWASEEGREGTVYVRFVVDEHCKVGSLSLLNTVGYGMDDEAMRVVSLIPKFKSPALVKGTPVKAYYQIPIRFRFK